MHPVELIFINWNSADLLFAAAATLDQTKMPYRICVVDNGSADDSCAQIRARLPDARLIEMGYNSGFATAVNAGLNAAEGRYALILNTDIEFQNDVPALLIEALQSFDAALACPDLRRPDGSLQAAVVPEPTLATELTNRIGKMRRKFAMRDLVQKKAAHQRAQPRLEAQEVQIGVAPTLPVAEAGVLFAVEIVEQDDVAVMHRRHLRTIDDREAMDIAEQLHFR